MRIRSTSSTTTSSIRHTPASGSTSSRGRDTPSADTAGPDDPIPSIEEGDDLPESAATPSSPSVVLTPPTVSSADDVVENSSRGGSMENHMRNLRLSSPRSCAGVTQLGVALDQVALDEPQRPESRSRRRRSRSATVNGGEPPRHQVRDEEMPPDRFHEPAFQKGFADARTLVGKLAHVLSQSPSYQDTGSTAKKLYDEATKLAAFEPPSTRTIGFVGDSGVGKSSLLNSLLDFENFARTSNGGAACTCVATEFHYHGTSNFKINVDRFTEGEVRDQLKDLVYSYQLFFLYGDMLESEDKILAEKAATLALDVFKVLFTGQLIDEEYLIKYSQEYIVDRMMSEILNKGYLNAIEDATFSTSAECSNALLGLTSESSSSDRSMPWPLIRKIKVYSNAIILSKGLVLVDLPGLRDLNAARRNITERYILHCDEIFVVCKIGRATTDVGVADVINLARQARLTGIGIICTRSDEIKPGEARQDWPGSRARTIQEFQDRIRRASTGYQRCTREMDEFDRDELQDPEILQEYLDLSKEKAEHATRKRQQEYQLMRFLINTRNQVITESLESQYRTKIPGATLRIFCVSNTTYWEKRNKSRDEALPYLTLSGIISLRKHCISVVGQSQRRLAARYVNDEIPAFLGDVSLWLESGAGTMGAERKRTIRRVLDTLDSRLTEELIGTRSPARSIARSAIQNFEQQMSQGLARPDWSRGARGASRVWSTWHHSSYAAFCRNFGDHSTPTVGKRIWNEEAMATMVADMEQPWFDIHTALRAHRSRTRNSMNEALEWSLTHLSDESDSDPDLLPILTVLIDAVGSRYRLLRAETEDAYDDFEAYIATFQIDAFSGIRTSIFGELVEDSYRACQAEYGAGSDRRRKNIIEGKMGEQLLFQQWETSFRRKFRELVENLEEEITQVAAGHVEVIQGTLDILRDENAESEADRDPAIRERLSREMVAARGDLRRIQQVVN